MDALPKHTIYVKNIYEKIGKTGADKLGEIRSRDADRHSCVSEDSQWHGMQS
jgi:hypothetical protein